MANLIWWRGPRKLPSIKTLRLVFGDRSKEARELLEGKRKTHDYDSVVTWVNSCYHHHPCYVDCLMVALNEIAGAYGVEYVEAGSNSKSPAFDYLNFGDSYNITLCFIYGKGFKVTDIASLIERGNYN